MAKFEKLSKTNRIYDMVENFNIQYAEVTHPDKPFRVISASDDMKKAKGNKYMVCITYTDTPCYITIIDTIADNEYNKPLKNVTASFYQDTLVLSDYLDNTIIDSIAFIKINMESEDKNNASD